MKHAVKGQREALIYMPLTAYVVVGLDPALNIDFICGHVKKDFFAALLNPGNQRFPQTFHSSMNRTFCGLSMGESSDTL